MVDGCSPSCNERGENERGEIRTDQTYSGFSRKDDGKESNKEGKDDLHDSHLQQKQQKKGDKKIRVIKLYSRVNV